MEVFSPKLVGLASQEARQDWRKNHDRIGGRIVSNSRVDLNRDSPEGRKLLEEAMYRYKISFDSMGRQTGASMRYVNQHSVLWGGITRQNFNRARWLGVCAGLAIEWLKAESKGEDFISDLIRVRNAMFITKKTDNDEGAFANWYIDKFANEVDDSHVLQNNVAKAVEGVLRVDGDERKSLFPYLTLTSVMKSNRYIYFGSATHAMGARTGRSFFSESKVDFYDPNVGEMRGTTIDGIAMYLRNAQRTTMALLGLPETALNGKVLTVLNMKKV